MAPRAYWKGYLKLSLVSCPIALFPATSEREKIRFHQINSETGNRIRYQKVDADTGEEVGKDQIVKGYEVDKGSHITLDAEELEAVAIESARTIDIAEFVPKDEIDELYVADPYYVVPDGEVGADAFAVIREAIRKEGMVAIGSVVFTSREHMIALEARDKGMLGMTLRYPYEVRDAAEYFDDIRDVKITKDMVELAQHIVESKRASFDPSKFEDRYEQALKDLLKRKQAGRPVKVAKQAAPTNVVNLMDALRRSISAEKPSQRAVAPRSPSQSRRAPAKRASVRARRAG